MRVLVDAYGRVPEDAVQTTLDTVETWLDPAEPFYMGWWENGRPDTENGRFEQVYDARIDADGLSFSFIPNGDSQELFGGFFPAATTIPSFETSFDPDGRVFTLRLYNTCLESGGPGSPLNEHLELMRLPKEPLSLFLPGGLPGPGQPLPAGCHHRRGRGGRGGDRRPDGARLPLHGGDLQPGLRQHPLLPHRIPGEES